MKRRGLVIGIVLLGVTAPAAHSSAAVTIGPDLAAVTPFNTYNCSMTKDCTLATTALGTIPATGGGMVSPVNGRIVSATAKTGAAGASDIVLRPITPAGALYTGGPFSAGIDFPPNATTTVPVPGVTRVKRGDIVGVQCCQNANDSLTSTAVPGSGAALGTWGTVGNPILGEGSSAAPDAINPNIVLMVNATIEPDNVPYVAQASLIRKGRFVAVRVGTTNFGKVVIGGGSPARVRETTTGGSSEATFELPVLKKARKLARKRGKLKFTVPVAYTPDFGTTNVVQTNPVTLRFKKKKPKKG